MESNGGDNGNQIKTWDSSHSLHPIHPESYSWNEQN